LLTLLNGDLSLLNGNRRCSNRADEERCDYSKRRIPPATETTVLADILADQLVFGEAAQGRRQLGDEISETRVAHARLGTGASPAGVDPARLVGETRAQAPRQCRRLRPVEIVFIVIPDDVAVGLNDQQALDRLVAAPEVDFLLDPRRVRRLRRGEQDEPLCRAQRVFDRRPERRVGRQTRLILKYAQRPDRVPPAEHPPRRGESLQAIAERRSQQVVGGMAVGDEGVVRRAPVRRCFRRALGILGNYFGSVNVPRLYHFGSPLNVLPARPRGREAWMMSGLLYSPSGPDRCCLAKCLGKPCYD
jgi:hypothetical protein